MVTTAAGAAKHPPSKTTTDPSQSTRFWIGFAVALVMGAAWPAAALVCAQPPWPAALSWIAHSATWGFFGLFILPIAVGLLVSGLDVEIVKMGKWSVPQRICLWLLLVCFGGLAVVIGKEDMQRPGTLPVYLANKEARTKAYELASCLRESSTNSARRQIGTRGSESLVGALISVLREDHAKQENIAKYKLLVDPDEEHSQPDLNRLACVSAALNIVLGFVAVALAWYLFVMGYTKIVHGYSSARSDRVLLAFACMGLWFPCRVYASWWAEHFYKQDVLSGYQGLMVLSAAFVVTAIAVALLRFNDTALGAKIVALGLFFAPLATAVAGLLSPQRLIEVAKAVEFLSPADCVAVGVIFSLLLGMVVCAVTINRAPGGATQAKKGTK